MGLAFKVLPPPRLLTLGMVAATLVGVIRLELRGGPPNELRAPMPPPSQQQTRVSVSASRNQDDQNVSTILARPLFSPTRRAPASAPAPKDALPELPRLTGVIVTPAGNCAIFAGTGDRKSVVIGEAARIGQYVVRSIEVNAVTVSGPGGQRVLHPAFDPNPPRAPAPIAPTVAPIIAPLPYSLTHQARPRDRD